MVVCEGLIVPVKLSLDDLDLDETKDESDDGRHRLYQMKQHMKILSEASVSARNGITIQ